MTVSTIPGSCFITLLCLLSCWCACHITRNELLWGYERWEWRHISRVLQWTCKPLPKETPRPLSCAVSFPRFPVCRRCCWELARLIFHAASSAPHRHNGGDREEYRTFRKREVLHSSHRKESRLACCIVSRSSKTRLCCWHEPFVHRTTEFQQSGG